MYDIWAITSSTDLNSFKCSFRVKPQSHWMKPNAHVGEFWDEELMAAHVPMLQYADFDIEAKHKEIAVQGFYNFELYAGLLSCT